MGNEPISSHEMSVVIIQWTISPLVVEYTDSGRSNDEEIILTCTYMYKESGKKEKNELEEELKNEEGQLRSNFFL